MLSWKMTTIFTQYNNLGPFWLEIDFILWTCSPLQAVISVPSDKSLDPTASSEKLEDKQTTQVFEYAPDHGLRTPREEKAFTAWPKIHSHSQIFSYLRPKHILSATSA